MNFDDALKHHLPRVWFQFQFAKYKHFGRGEPELKLVRHLIERGSTAIDIGLSIGMFANEMARHAGRVIAFEANPAVADFARGLLPRNVEVINAALSAQAGCTTLRIPRTTRGRAITELGTIAPENLLPGIDTISVEVATQRLDDQNIANCSFIKIDVEGHEEAVLDGAAHTITTQRPAVLVEINESSNAGGLARAIARFAAQSYGGFYLTRGRLRPIAEFDRARDQDDSLLSYGRGRLPPGREYINNFIFVPEEKGARILAHLS